MSITSLMFDVNQVVNGRSFLQNVVTFLQPTDGFAQILSRRRPPKYANNSGLDCNAIKRNYAKRVACPNGHHAS
jgi:hypothetical protein